MGKRNKLLVAVFLCLMFGVVSCKKKEEAVEKKSIYEVMTKYETENMNAYTIDEDGNVYTVELVMGEGEDAGYYLRKYDKDGNRLFSKPVDTLFGYSSTNIGALAVKDGILYIAPYRHVDESFYQMAAQIPYNPETGQLEGELTEEMIEFLNGNKGAGDDSIVCSILFSYDPANETVTRLREFTCFKQVLRILVSGEHIYLLGRDNEENGIRSSFSGTDSKSYVSGGEKIVRYTPATKEEVTLGIEEPIDIALNGEGDLLIHANRKDGFQLLQYNAERDAVKVLKDTDGIGMYRFAYSPEEDCLLYTPSTDVGLVCAKLSDLNDVCVVYPWGYEGDNGLLYNNGKVICIAENNGNLVQFPLGEIKKENKTIRYIYTGSEWIEPYGCGYRMEKKEYTQDKLTLKLLALDEDFDLCLASSAYDSADALKENGTFYPLNEVSGIEDYLDACFPYVREAATKEDGSIWMLPIHVNIPAFVYDTAMEDSISVPFTPDMTYEEFFAAQEALTEEQRLLTFNGAIEKDFLYRYLHYNTSLDTAEFRKNMTLFMEGQDLFPLKDSDLRYEYVKGSYIYDCQTLSTFLRGSINSDSYGEAARAYGYPRIEREDKNLGTCVFFVVNPKSDDLKATLSYLEDLIAYQMNQELRPLYFQTPDESGDSYEGSLYELYRNGEITFYPEEDLIEGYDEVIEGKKSLEDFITETDHKLDMYLRE